MLKKIDKYCQTLKYLKKSQLLYLAKNRLERGQKADTKKEAPACKPQPLWMPDLDGASLYLKRFDTEEILEGRVKLLYEEGIPGGRDWHVAERSHLWNFNLHYMEFLIPLAAAYKEENDIRYYECFKEYCLRWILDNENGRGDGWHPYTISLRLTNLWICISALGETFLKDQPFCKMLNGSMYAQYLHLQKRLERHLLGNHYFENLKTVLLGALYFQEERTYRKYKRLFTNEVREQILPDGMHYERSLMYHKIILEDIMRVAKSVYEKDGELYQKLCVTMQKMTDAVWSLEQGMGRTLLFNDAGDNVARPLDCLLKSLKKEFGICPGVDAKKVFPDAGYYCLEEEGIKSVMDAGKIAPDYMPGHSHCDGLSFELSWHGRPVFVNSGTGQYQGRLRSYFRSTAAHNTIVVDGEEQSDCWGEHRTGRRIKDVSGGCKDHWIYGKLTTCTGKRISRAIGLKGNMVCMKDRAKGQVKAYFHLAPEYVYSLQDQKIVVKERADQGRTVCELYAPDTDRVTLYEEGDICSYAPEFGRVEEIQVLSLAWKQTEEEHKVRIKFMSERTYHIRSDTDD